MSLDKVTNRITEKGAGWLFSASDFLDLVSRANADQVLSRLAKAGKIRRLTRGLYDSPKTSALFGELFPSPEQIAAAITRNNSQVLLPSPSWAANHFGLSTQVPATTTYMTNGPTRTKRVGNVEIRFKHVGPKTLVGAGSKTGIVFQALRYLGKDRSNRAALRTIALNLTAEELSEVSKQSLKVQGWIRPLVKEMQQIGSN